MKNMDTSNNQDSNSGCDAPVNSSSSIEQQKPLTECMMGRDAECNHPLCPYSEEDPNNIIYCTLPLYDYRE